MFDLQSNAFTFISYPNLTGVPGTDYGALTANDINTNDQVVGQGKLPYSRKWAFKYFSDSFVHAELHV